MYQKVVAVGALGGSGTRVIAEILRKLNIFIGNNLNPSLDNLLFAQLFKNPEWFRQLDNQDIIDRIEIFEHLMTQQKLSQEKRKKYIKISFLNQLHRSWAREIRYNYLTVIKELYLNITRKRRPVHIWGWKEPNTHLYLKYLSQYFQNFKYIHVIRHGLDMAYSKNLQQLHNWGWLYNISVPSKMSDLPKAQLNYWIKANRATLELSKKYLSGHFLVIKYDSLCEEPKVWIEKIISFLNIKVNSNVLKQIYSIPKIPASIGRYKQHDITIFTLKQLLVVKELGFSIK